MKKDLIKLQHLFEMTDSVGLVEHATGRRPNLGEGYSVDDNARAIQVCLRLEKDFPELKLLLPKYLDFVHRAERERGFALDWEQAGYWKEENLTGEHFGRALAALCEAGEEMSRHWEAAAKVQHTRTAAQILGALLWVKPVPTELVQALVGVLKRSWLEQRTDSWHWFEETLSYDNGRLPMGMLGAFLLTNEAEYLEIAKESLDFLMTLCWDKKGEFFSFPGNKGWYKRGGERFIFDQQPIEAGSMTEACALAYRVTQEEKYLLMAEAAFGWYLGNNIAHQKMVDPVNGGVFDGLGEDRSSVNEGAESMLSYLLAWGALPR